MKKINKLTDKQELGIIEWRDHCIDIGRRTDSVDKKNTEKAWTQFYQKLGLKRPYYWYCQSPLQANVIINILKNVSAKIRDNIGVNIGVNIRDNLRENTGVNISENISENIGDKIVVKNRDNIVVKIRDNIVVNIGNYELIPTYIPTYGWCQHDIHWIAYFLFFERYSLLKTNSDFEVIKIWYLLAKSCGWCYTFENMVFVCEKPCEINLNTSGQLHKNSDMALKYSDGYGLYMLNGVNVPEYLAVTKSEKLDIEFFKKETNADVKAEFIRKFGIDRMVSMGKKVDTYKNYSNGEWWDKSRYELIDMSPIFPTISYAPHIKMVNQTIKGVYHLESVAPECKNLEQALNWREETKNKKYKTISIN